MRFNEMAGREMDTLTYEECVALAVEAFPAGIPQYVQARLDSFFGNGQDFAWAEYIREAIAKPQKGRPVRMSERLDLVVLTAKGDN